jgi:rhomboid protease GluP
VTFLIGVVFLAGVLIWHMTPAERRRLLKTALAYVRQAKLFLTDAGAATPAFGDALHARTARVIVTPAVAAATAATFVLMFFGAGALSDPETLITWGANYAPRTTNGEWWRLFSAMFVHQGAVAVLVNVAAIVQLGFILERLVGPYALASVYLTAGIFANIVCLAVNPVAVSFGASGAIFGLCGLFIASWVWALLSHRPLAFPLPVLKRVTPVLAAFFVYNALTGALQGSAELVGLGVGVVFGLVFAKGIAHGRTPARPVRVATAVAVAIAVVGAVPLRGLHDAREELARLIGLEARTADEFRAQLLLFNRGDVAAAGLVQQIDRTILPELRTADSRLTEIGKVPRDQEMLIADATAYLQLRQESWRLRADGLRESSLAMLRRADETEQRSWEVLRRIKSAGAVSQYD